MLEGMDQYILASSFSVRLAKPRYFSQSAPCDESFYFNGINRFEISVIYSECSRDHVEFGRI